MNFYKLIILSAIVLLVSCESMEDTYSEFTKDGKSRYLGRVSDISIESGWKRLNVSWKNSIDPNIDSLKIVCSAEGYIDSIVLDKNTTSYETPANLENKIYRFDIYSVDEYYESSLSASAIAKPFTELHEGMVHMPVIKKYFFVNDLFLIKFNNPDDKIEKAVINYFEGEEEKQREILEDEMWWPGYIVIENVNTKKPIFLNKKLIIEECYDPVEINNQELSTSVVNFNQDFKDQLKHIYNRNIIDESFVNNLDTLYLDYDLFNLEDVAFFPNLKKIVIGKHRYFRSDPNQSRITDYNSRKFTQLVFENLISKKKVKVEFCGIHYYPLSNLKNSYNLTGDDKARITISETPKLPEIDYFDMSEWTIISSSTIDGHEDNVKSLIDNDYTTKWEPFAITGNMRTHEIIIDMKEIKNLKGFVVNQSEGWSSYRQNQFQIMISNEGNSWKTPFSFNHCMMGNSGGETAIFNIKEGSEVSARYVKIVINDVVSPWSEVKNVELGDFIPF